MTARLMAFYPGVDPVRVWAEWPMGFVRGLCRMIPRLRAEQSFEAADQVSVGINAAFAKDSPSPARRWLDALRPPEIPTDRRAKAETTLSNARAFGIGVRVVKAGAR